MSFSKHSQFLRNKDLSALLTYNKKPLIHVEPTTTVEQALDLFATHNILSAPIFDKIANDFTGTVSVWDLMSHILLTDPPGSMDHKVSSIQGTSRESSKFFVFRMNDRLEKLLEPFSNGIHRVLVEQKPPSQGYVIFSQSDVINYFLEVEDQLGSLLDITVDNIKPLKLPTLIRNSSSALEGYKTIRQNNVYAVGVVDENGKLVANLSASDLRGLKKEQLDSLTKPNFIQATNFKNKKLVTVSSKDTLFDCMNLMAENKVHRVWVVDPKGHPLGVVTLTDCIRAFCEHQE